MHIVADSSKLLDKVPDDMNAPFKIELGPESFKSYIIDPPTRVVEVNKNMLIHMYHEMVKMRRMEVAADQAYKHKLVRGFCHLAIGQEAVSVGMQNAINPDDNVITAYRCHTFAVQRGGSMHGLFAELFGACNAD